MPRGSHIIEIFAPTGFTRDYEMLTSTFRLLSLSFRRRRDEELTIVSLLSQSRSGITITLSYVFTPLSTTVRD